MKTVYKSSVFKKISNILSMSIFGFILAIILSHYINITFTVIILIIFTLLIIYSELSENFIFEIEGTKFRHFNGKTLIKEYELKEAKISYSIKKSLKNNSVDLFINDDIIDCESLNSNDFNTMYLQMEKLTGIKQKIIVGGKKYE